MDIIREAAQSLASDNQPGVDPLVNLHPGSFTAVVLTDDGALSFKTVINKCGEEKKAAVIECIAELAKTEENRNILAANGIVNVLLNEIEGNDHDVMLQCFRAVGNICLDNDEGRRAVLASGCIATILDKFRVMADLSDEELGNLPRMAYGCVNNISDENESLQLELIKNGAIPIFFNCFKSFANKHSEMAELVMEALSALAVNDTAKHQFIELQIIEESLSLLQQCTDNIAMVILNSLCEFSEDDELSNVMCSEKCLLSLIAAGKERENLPDKNENDEVLKKIFDTLVLFTSNESFEADCSNKALLNSFLDMLKSKNKHIQISAALALGNYARNEHDSSSWIPDAWLQAVFAALLKLRGSFVNRKKSKYIVCADLVKEDVHTALIDFLKSVVDKEDTSDQIQAVLSALKNIAIPVANKSVLVKTDLPSLAIGIVKSSAAALQFKALAILRLLVQGQTGLAVELSKDHALLQSIAECSQKEVIPGLCAEARRLTAAIAKNCHSSDALNSLLENNAMGSLVGLLSSDHAIMQNEGLVAMVTLLACGTGASTAFIKADGIDKATTIFKQSRNKSHLVFNLISLFTAICQDENGKALLQEKIMKEVEEMVNGPNEMVQNRCVELLKIMTT